MSGINIKRFGVKYFDHEVSSRYLSDIRKYSVPTAEEEHELILRIQSGDESARNELIVRNQRFIFAMAKGFAVNAEEIGDYVSEGNVGMIDAINRGFDLSRGIRFMSYAVWYIRRSMRAYLMNKTLVRKTNQSKIGNKVEKIKYKFMNEKGTVPTVEETIDLLNEMYNIKVSEQDIRDMNIISINDELNEDYMVEDDSEYNKATASNNQYEDDIENEYLKYKVDLLLKYINKYPKEKEVIKMLFGVGYDRAYTNIEVGEMFAMKDVEVESLKRKIISYLKRKVTSNSAKKQLPSSEE